MWHTDEADFAKLWAGLAESMRYTTSEPAIRFAFSALAGEDLDLDDVARLVKRWVKGGEALPVRWGADGKILETILTGRHMPTVAELLQLRKLPLPDPPRRPAAPALEGPPTCRSCGAVLEAEETGTCAACDEVARVNLAKINALLVGIGARV